VPGLSKLVKDKDEFVIGEHVHVKYAVPWAAKRVLILEQMSGNAVPHTGLDLLLYHRLVRQVWQCVYGRYAFPR
jgi:hypothetical protein